MTPPSASNSAGYGTSLWWLSAATAGAYFTARGSASLAADGLLWWLVLLLGCGLLRAIAHRGLRSRGVGWFAVVIFLLAAALGASRLEGRTWLTALPVVLLAAQAVACIAATRRMHVWLSIAAGATVLLLAAPTTHSSWYLPCAALFTLVALHVLVLEQRSACQRAAAFASIASRDHRVQRAGGGSLFTAATLLLTIPIYLFLPKPAGWSEDEPAPTGLRNERPPPLPVPPALESTPLSAPLAPATAVAIEGSGHVARPERGDYGQDFGIADVERHQAGATDIVLYARSSHPVNLRGRIYDRFEANTWSRTLGPPERIELDAGTLTFAAPSSGPTRVTQDIEVTRELEPTLVHAPGVRRLRFPARSLLRYDDDVLVANASLPAATLYSVDARLTLRTGRYLLSAAPPLDLAAYLQADSASPRLRALAQRLSETRSGALAKALALEEHLRTQYQYTYEAPGSSSAAPLDDFLFTTRRGHCELFASALALMLRSVGIPARLATGFSLGDPNPITGFHEVRALDAHAWVEAYLEGEGWLMLEPTPFYPLPRPGVDRQVAEQLDGYLERLAATRTLLEPDTPRTRATVWVHSAWRSARSASSVATEGVRSLGWKLPLALSALVLALPAGYLLALAAVDWFDNLRIRRALQQLPREARAATLAAATALLRMAAPRSCARRQDWTLREYAQRLNTPSTLHAVIAIPEEFIDAFDRARYHSNADASAVPLTAVIEPVVQLVRERIRNDPWPRLRAAAERLRRRVMAEG